MSWKQRTLAFSAWGVLLGPAGILAIQSLSVTIPSPPLDAMEPQVAAKLRDTRNDLVASQDSPDAWGRYGRVLHAHGLLGEAALAYRQAERLSPGAADWLYLEAQALKGIDAQRAREAVEQAVSHDSGLVPGWILRAELDEHFDDDAAALAAYERAISLNPEVAVAHFGRGRLLLRRGELETARQALERAAEQAPSSGAVQAALARLYRRSGQDELAGIAAERARRLTSEIDLADPLMAAVQDESVSIVGYQTRARNAELQGDLDRAESHLRRIVELQPGEADPHFNLGNFLSRHANPAPAEAAYREALRQSPTHVGALMNLGTLLAQTDRAAEAETLFRRVTEIEGDHPGALVSLGNLRVMSGDIAGAIRLYESAIERDRRSGDAHYGLAQIFASRGSFARAIPHLESAVRTWPDRGGVQAELAIAYARDGRFDESWTAVDSAQALGVEFPAEFLRELERMAPR